jgi:hypothetical protein
MQHISKLLESYRLPLDQLIEKYKALTPSEVQTLSAWQRSSYREVMKFADKPILELDNEIKGK